VAANFAACEKLLLDARVHFLLAHHHPALASRLDSDHFQRIELDRDVLIPVTAPAVRAGRRDKTKPRYSLPGSPATPLPYLAYHPGSGIGRIVSAALAGKEPAAALAPGFAAPVMLLIDMAREGRGITWAPRSLVELDLADGRLLRAGREDWDIAIGICLFRARARMTNAAEALWDTVRRGKPARRLPVTSLRAR
jgi:LysR family transcriptional regulator, hypochlorite-specific transcription factor HypT